jgi:hypothetical protein
MVDEIFVPGSVKTQITAPADLVGFRRLPICYMRGSPPAIKDTDGRRKGRPDVLL